MADAVSLKMIGDWRKEVGVGLKDMLHVSMDVMGRTGEEACRHALILMAQSARAIANQSKKNRVVMHDAILGPYVEVFNKRGERIRRYKWAVEAQNEVTWAEARLIGYRGLAKAAWMWGIDRLGGKVYSAARGYKPIAGTSRVFTIRGERVNGYVKQNRLDYIAKAMPAGWESQVQIRAGNKGMAQARGKLERQWKSRMRRRERIAARSIQSYFLKVAA